MKMDIDVRRNLNSPVLVSVAPGKKFWRLLWFVSPAERHSAN